MLASTPFAEDQQGHVAAGTRFLLQLHHPVMAHNSHRPSRLHRRLSHPPSSIAGRARLEQEDGQFIKRAFENLSLDPGPSTSSSVALHPVPFTRDTGSASAGENADNATNVETNTPTQYAYSTGSRMSIASTSSQPYSSLSGYTQLDRESVRSSQPLITHDVRELSASPHSGIAAGTRHSRTVSSNNQKGPNDSSSYAFRSSLEWSSFDRHDNLGDIRPAERRPAPSSSRPNLPTQPTLHSQDDGTFSDPFTEDSRDKPHLRLRRSSTISGYSVSTSDWNSLRRGSLASLEHASPNLAPYNELGNDASPNAYSLPRSRNTMNASVQGQVTSASADPTPASAYANMARSQQRLTSLRWEAWAAAYRESLLQDIRSGLNTFYPGKHAPRYLNRHPSISEETSSSILERHNPFYRLRRQFLARAGSRGESNRILALELCHALEEYEAALGTLCRLAHSISPHTRIASLSSSMVSTPTDTPARSPSPSIVDAALPPSPRNRSQMSSNLDKRQLERLAGEVDSLIREIIEAVPAFSYSLSQGSYGALPAQIKTEQSMAMHITIQQYLEQVHVLQSQYPSSSSRLAPHRHYVAPTDTISRVIPDFEQEGIDMASWWPNRLRMDLREGLLMDDVEDSPKISLQGSSVLSTTSYRQEASGAEAQVGAATESVAGNDTPGAFLTDGTDGRDRNNQLLAEGRRRWTEYLQGRE